MKQVLLLILFVFGITTILFSQLSLSLVAKGNYGFGDIQNSNLNSSQERFENTLSFLDIAGPNSSIELRVRPAFEIGIEGGFALNTRLNAIFGLNFQQIRLEALPEQISFETPKNTLSHIYYLKIPLGLELDLYKDKLFLQAGIYAASKIAYHHKELDRKASNPLVFERRVPANSFSEINSSEQFNSLLFGFQTGIKYQFWKKLSLDMSYSHSLNNLFNEDTALDMNLNNFSFGLQWRFI